MEPLNFATATHNVGRVLCAPRPDGLQVPSTTLTDDMRRYSLWRPSDEEIEALANGGVVKLTVGDHTRETRIGLEVVGGNIEELT